MNAIKLANRCIFHYLNSTSFRYQAFSILSVHFYIRSQKLNLHSNHSYYTSPKSEVDSLIKGPGFGSRYHPPSPREIIDEKIKDILQDKTSLSLKEWEDVRNELMSNHDILTEANFDSVLMNCLLIQENVNLGHSFMNYLKEYKRQPNFLTCIMYMSLCGQHACDQDLILKEFQKVKSLIDAAPVLDVKRAMYIIQGLCATSEWKRSFDYLKKVPCQPNWEIKSTLAIAALKNNQETLAWEIITKWFKEDEHPSPLFLKQYVLLASSIKETSQLNSDSLINKLFTYINAKDIVITVEVAREIINYFSSHKIKWKISYSKADKNGTCSACKNQLKIMDLEHEEFMQLKEAFLEQVVKKSDIFINSTPKEFNKFINVIEKHKPFDIVLDGLNIAHSKNGSKTRYTLSKHLLKVVNTLSQNSSKILVLGRHHMLYWPKPILQQIAKKAVLFLTHNISQDDPYAIYAALASGPHTNILSLDLMRDHISRLKEAKMIYLFKRWQDNHQIYLKIDENNNVKFSGPLNYSIKIQGNMTNGWHIPYDDKIILDPYEKLNNWLCIQKIPY